MAYIFEMASGTEYLGDELCFRKPAAVPGSASPATPSDCQVQLRLTPVSESTARTARPDFHAGLNMSELIENLDT